MFFLLPFRAKNPPDHFPFATIVLIALNIFVFLLTSERFWEVRRDIVQDYALTHNNMSVFRIFTSMFLHGDLFHLAGNMLFLWVFGSSVEGRLGPIKFLLAYFLAGIAGDLLHDVIFGPYEPDIPSLGASGAIMGVAGAYLFLFPFSTICVFFIFWPLVYIRAGVAEWQARWVVLYFVGFDIVYAYLFKGADGVGHFAHLGGVGMGLLVCVLMRPVRDSEEVSAVKVVHAEMQDYSLLSLSELGTLLQRPTDDMRLVMAYCEKAATHAGGEHSPRCLAMLNQYARPLIQEADPQRLAYTLLHIPVHFGGMHPTYYLRLASLLEAQSSNDLASQLYRRVYDLNQAAPDSEAALFRLGQIMQNVFRNYAYAQTCYAEQLRLFPNGEMSLQARRALQHLQGGGR
jgi:membrane associated rhomboid family serine protease